MDIVKKFRLALELNDMTYLSFAEKHGLSKQAISLAVQALKYGYTFSARVEKIITDYSNEQMQKLKNLLNSDKAA